MSESRTFDLGDILTVTTGILMSPEGIDGVYDVLNFMTGDSLFTHQLPRACREVAPVVLRQHPALAQIALNKMAPADVAPTLHALKAVYGEALTLTPMSDYQPMDPLLELASMTDKAIIPIKVP